MHSSRRRLTEQAVKSSLSSKKEADKAAEKSKKALEDAGTAAEEIIAKARAESDEIRQKAEKAADDIRKKAEREAHEKARRETAVMLSQAKIMADEIHLNAKQKAEKIEAEAKAAAAHKASSDFERPLSVSAGGTEAPGSDGTESGAWDMKHAEEAQKSFDAIIGEAMSKAESIIKNARAEAEVITSSLIGRTLGELNKEHERLLAAVQTAVHKSEQIVKAAREEAEQFAVQRKCDAAEQCNAVLIEAERKAGAIFSNLKSQAGARKVKTDEDGKSGPGGKRDKPEIPVRNSEGPAPPLLPPPFSKKPRSSGGAFFMGPVGPPCPPGGANYFAFDRSMWKTTHVLNPLQGGVRHEESEESPRPAGQPETKGKQRYPRGEDIRGREGWREQAWRTSSSMVCRSHPARPAMSARSRRARAAPSRTTCSRCTGKCSRPTPG